MQGGSLEISLLLDVASEASPCCVLSSGQDSSRLCEVALAAWRGGAGLSEVRA